MDIDFDLTHTASEKDRLAILRPLVAYNTAKVGSTHYKPLNVIIRDQVSAKPLGGLWGYTAFEWLYIDLLFVPENLRNNGNGKRLLIIAENEARARHCHSARLDTHEFQGAKGFYEICGYTVYGKIDDNPAGFARYYMQKKL